MLRWPPANIDTVPVRGVCAYSSVTGLSIEVGSRPVAMWSAGRAGPRYRAENSPSYSTSVGAVKNTKKYTRGYPPDRVFDTLCSAGERTQFGCAPGRMRSEVRCTGEQATR